MYSNNSFDGKCMSIVGPKLTRPPGDPNYRGPDYRRTTLFIIFTLCNTYTASTSPVLVQTMSYITKLLTYLTQFALGKQIRPLKVINFCRLCWDSPCPVLRTFSQKFVGRVLVTCRIL